MESLPGAADTEGNRLESQAVQYLLTWQRASSVALCAMEDVAAGLQPMIGGNSRCPLPRLPPFSGVVAGGRILTLPLKLLPPERDGVWERPAQPGDRSGSRINPKAILQGHALRLVALFPNTAALGGSVRMRLPPGRVQKSAGNA